MSQKPVMIVEDSQAPRYRLSTSFFSTPEGALSIRKEAGAPQAQDRTDAILQGYSDLRGAFAGLRLAPCRKDGRAVVYEGVRGRTYLSVLRDAAAVSAEAYLDAWKAFAAAVQPSADNRCAFAPSPESIRLFGQREAWEGVPACRACFLDILPFNVLSASDGALLLTDYAWPTAFPAPVGLILTHAVWEVCRACPDLAAVTDAGSVLAALGVPEAQQAADREALAAFRTAVSLPQGTPTEKLLVQAAVDAAYQARRENTASEPNTRKDDHKRLRSTQKKLDNTARELESAREQARYAQERLRLTLADNAQLSQLYRSVLNARTWRLTAPLRFAGHAMRSVVGRCARGAYRLYQRHRREPRAASRAYPVLAPCDRVRKHHKTVVDDRTASRLGIYFFYDRDGVADDYVSVFLAAFARCVQRLVIVCNGEPTPDSRQKLAAFTDEILIRKNEGFDSWAYKAAMEAVGYRELAKYDEVILTNFTIMGPVSPLEDMLKAMAERDVDFWGISAHPGLDFDPFECCPYGHIPEHLQFYFVAFRKPMLTSDFFVSYWKNLPPVRNYNEAVGLHEAVFTQYFAERGFVWDSFLDRDAYYPLTDNPLVCAPVYAIRELGCPVFKRRAFFQDFDYLISYTAGETAGELLRYVDQSTPYDVDLVWANLLRTCHMSELRETLGLTRVLPKHLSHREEAERALRKHRIALVMHLYDPDMAAEMAAYARSLPPEADIYVSTTSEAKKTAILEAFSRVDAHTEVRVLPNRGRDVSVLLAGVRDVLPAYEYICVTHDKKSAHLHPGTVGEGFAYTGYQNILASRDFVYNVVEAFENDPRLGLLETPAPNHADFITYVGLEWGRNFEVTRALAQELGIQVPMDEKHPPCAPIGSSFWARTKALEPLLRKPWTYEDFPAEPLKETDGTILHAVERIYPFAAQQAGYYTSRLMTDEEYAVEAGNLEFYAQNYTGLFYDERLRGRYVAVRDQLDAALGESRRRIRYRTKKTLKAKVFQWMEW